MVAPSRDPKGYYRILGLSPGVEAGAIKAAYRKKALQLHPDRNKSPNAVAEFQRLHDAYQTLSDPKTRQTYDTLPATPPPADPSPRHAQTHAQGQAQARPQQTQTHAPRPPPPGQKAVQTPQACCACGTVTAQPRYIILEKVTGRGLRVDREPISGVFCRRCAERYAFLASLHCWLKGWWAFPLGPPRTLSALWVNLRGGLKPARENSQLLLRQARAFLARGDRALAQGLAEQALALAPASGREYANAERMVNALGAEPARRLRDVWRGPGPGFWLQLTPPAGLLLVGGLIALPWFRPTFAPTETAPALTPAQPLTARGERPNAPPPTDRAPVAPVTLPQGRIHSVAAPTVALRTGPGTQYEAAALAKRGTFLVVLEVDADGVWARAMTAQGLVGFVPLDLLRPIAAEDGSAAPDTAPPGD
jgi:hypothetical protein